MSTQQLLAGKRIAVLAANGVDQDEMRQASAALTTAGAEVTIVAPNAGRIRCLHDHQPGELLRVGQRVEGAVAADYDGLLVPGGYVSPDLLRQSAPARGFVRQMDALARPQAFLSQAPQLLVSAGLARQRVLTGWPGIRDDLVNAGAVWRNEPLVRDGHYLFGRSPQDIAAIAKALPAFFAGEAPMATDAATATAAAAATDQVQSDPPQDAPSEAPDEPLRWLSAPSVGAMLSLAILGVGVVAANRGRRKHKALSPPEPWPDPPSEAASASPSPASSPAAGAR
jgi:protease I